MDIKTFLISPTPALSDYPLDEVANAIDNPTEGNHFLDDIGDDLVGALELAKKYRIANIPLDKAALEMQALVANVLAYSVEKHDPEGRMRTLSNVLNSAKVLKMIADDVRAAARELSKRKK